MYRFLYGKDTGLYGDVAKCHQSVNSNKQESKQDKCPADWMDRNREWMDGNREQRETENNGVWRETGNKWIETEYGEKWRIMGRNGVAGNDNGGWDGVCGVVGMCGECDRMI